jgi:hypothetical protein
VSVAVVVAALAETECVDGEGVYSCGTKGNEKRSKKKDC